MLKRLNVYFKEMHPIAFQLLVGLTLFFEIYFLVILTNRRFELHIGISEMVGGLTIFGFLMFLRIADDFKDYETDLKLFPDRPLPSGRVTKRDLKIVLLIDLALITVLNVLFMNNLHYFVFLMVYGVLMSVWFFSKARIQKSLPLALVTHNPIQLVINAYIISFTCIKYHIAIMSYVNLLVLVSLYFDGLVWEIARKIRAPEEETQYVTYSKIFGYKKPVALILLIMFMDFITSTLMVTRLFPWAILGTVIGYIWFALRCRSFFRDPKKFKMKSLMEQYMYVTELYIVILIVAYLVTKVF